MSEDMRKWERTMTKLIMLWLVMIGTFGAVLLFLIAKWLEVV